MVYRLRPGAAVMPGTRGEVEGVGMTERTPPLRAVAAAAREGLEIRRGQQLLLVFLGLWGVDDDVAGL